MEDETTLHEEELSRRRFLRRAATVGWTTPLIVSALTTPAFADHVEVGSPCNATTQHCVATSVHPVSGATLTVVCCTTGVNTGKCGWPSGTVTATGGTPSCGGCCSGACGSGSQNRTCT